MSYLYKFSVDVYSASFVSGWCFHRFLKRRDITLSFWVDDHPLGQCKANLLREDVKAGRLHPTGYCGFTFNLPDNFQQLSTNSPLIISVVETETQLCSLHANMQNRIVASNPPFFSRVKKLFPQFTTQEKPIFFMHIPKTAGTTFNSFANKLFASGECINHIEFYDRSEFARLGSQFHFISGHLQLREVKQLFPTTSFQYYTLLRDPYRHLHSHLNWLRGIGADKKSTFYKTHHDLFKELADYFASNPQLGAKELQHIVDSLSGVLKEIVDNCQVRHFLDKKVDRVSKTDLDEALTNIPLFSAIGLTEQYEEFQNIFCNQQAITPPEKEKSLNRSRFAPLYDTNDPQIREVVNPLIKYDLDLYNHVKNRV